MKFLLVLRHSRERGRGEGLIISLTLMAIPRRCRMFVEVEHFSENSQRWIHLRSSYSPAKLMIFEFNIYDLGTSLNIEHCTFIIKLRSLPYNFE